MGRTSDADERLMNAALELMWQESYGSVSIDDICQRAGVKKGSFYYFFDSKAALAVGALEKLWREDWRPKMDSIFSSAVEPLARLKTYFEGVYNRQCECSKQKGKVLGCPVFSVGSEVSTQEIDVSAKIREILGRKRRYLESAIRDALAEGSIEDCDPTQKALQLACLIDGAVSQARIMNDPDMLKSLPTLAMDILRPKATRPVATVTAAR